MLYKQEGFAYTFDASACDSCGGRCCTGESGYIKLTLAEAEAIAKLLGLSTGEFALKYLIKIGYGFSLKEKEYDDGYACVFFDESAKNCGIYDVRPQQCRTFPFWDVFKQDEKEVRKECPGII